MKATSEFTSLQGTPGEVTEARLQAYAEPPPRKNILQRCISAIIFAGVAPFEWRSKVWANTPLAIFYRLSSFFYNLVGVLAIVFHDQLQEYDRTFWWIPVGCLLNGQGVITYMADVRTWGTPSRWKKLGVVYATVLTLTCGPGIVIRGAIGLGHYPIAVPIAWTLSVTFAMFCKFMSTRSLRLELCEDYMFWHGLWHSLPAYASGIILCLGIRKL